MQQYNGYYSGKYAKKISIPNLVASKIEANVAFLMELMQEHQSPSQTIHERDFSDWLFDYVRKIDGVKAERDHFGNLLITKGMSALYPCVVAHVDSAQDYSAGLEIIKTKDYIIGFDNVAGEQMGVSGDDKCGVAFALEMLKFHPVLKVALTLQEEVGGIGAYNMHLDFFKDCTFAIQLDRRSYSNDLIERSNGCDLMSKKFKEALKPIMKKYNYKFNTGTFTDVGCLKDEGLPICCMNVSAGYYNEHMSDEIVGINAFKNAVSLGNDIITDLSWRKWEHAAPAKKQLTYSGGTTSKYSGRYYDWEDWDYGKGWYTEESKTAKTEEKKKSKKEVYHHSNHWAFTKEDSQYIADELEIGQCPMCQAGNLIELEEGEQVCRTCSSVYNIPVGKAMWEITEEMMKIEEGV